MNNKYLIAFDMDGTLLKSDGTVGEESKKILKEIMAGGDYVSIASGRPSRVVTPFYEELGLNGPVVSYNGCRIYSPNDDSFPVREKTFPKEIVKKFLFDIGYENIDYVMVEGAHTVYINKFDQTIDGFFHPTGMEIIEGNVLENIKEDAFVVILGMNTHKYDEILVKSAFQFKGLGLRFWGGIESKFSELYYLDTSKTTGIEIARKTLNIEKDHVIVIGDADNDVDMITEYPNSIAMINGEKQVIERAHYVSDFDNNNDGAAKAVFKLLTKLKATK